MRSVFQDYWGWMVSAAVLLLSAAICYPFVRGKAQATVSFNWPAFLDRAPLATPVTITGFGREISLAKLTPTTVVKESYWRAFPPTVQLEHPGLLTRQGKVSENRILLDVVPRPISVSLHLPGRGVVVLDGKSFATDEEGRVSLPEVNLGTNYSLLATLEGHYPLSTNLLLTNIGDRDVDLDLNPVTGSLRVSVALEGVTPDDARTILLDAGEIEIEIHQHQGVIRTARLPIPSETLLGNLPTGKVQVALAKSAVYRKPTNADSTTVSERVTNQFALRLMPSPGTVRLENGPNIPIRITDESGRVCPKRGESFEVFPGLRKLTLSARGYHDQVVTNRVAPGKETNIRFGLPRIGADSLRPAKESFEALLRDNERLNRLTLFGGTQWEKISAERKRLESGQRQPDTDLNAIAVEYIDLAQQLKELDARATVSAKMSEQLKASLTHIDEQSKAGDYEAAHDGLVTVKQQIKANELLAQIHNGPIAALDAEVSKNFKKQMLVAIDAGIRGKQWEESLRMITRYMNRFSSDQQLIDIRNRFRLERSRALRGEIEELINKKWFFMATPKIVLHSENGGFTEADLDAVKESYYTNYVVYARSTIALSLKQGNKSKAEGELKRFGELLKDKPEYRQLEAMIRK